VAWEIEMRSFAELLLVLREEGVTRTRTLERLWSWPSEVPTSKYSISSDVCEGNFLRRVPPPWGLVGVVVLMVMGVPSSGTE
jgi:hypothetical protein